MYLHKLDPTQLVALHLLLEETSVSRAAQRMSITQSSMSHRLNRLREQLGDPLLVRKGRGLVKTSRAVAIAGPLGEAMQALEEAIAPRGDFTPRDLVGPFVLYLPDLLAPLLSSFVKSLRLEAPRLEFVVKMVPSDLDEALSDRIPSLALAPASFGQPHLIHKKLGSLRFGVVGRKGHPALRRRPSLRRWLAFSHIVMEVGNSQKNPVDEVLRKRRLKRDVVLRVPSFLTGLLTVASSDFLMNAPLALARDAARTLDLSVQPTPFPLPQVPFSMLWHERVQHDPAHEWVRTKLAEQVRGVLT